MRNSSSLVHNRFSTFTTPNHVVKSKTLKVLQFKTRVSKTSTDCCPGNNPAPRSVKEPNVDVFQTSAPPSFLLKSAKCLSAVSWRNQLLNGCQLIADTCCGEPNLKSCVTLRARYKLPLSGCVTCV